MKVYEVELVRPEYTALVEVEDDATEREIEDAAIEELLSRVRMFSYKEYNP